MHFIETQLQINPNLKFADTVKVTFSNQKQAIKPNIEEIENNYHTQELNLEGTYIDTERKNGQDLDFPLRKSLQQVRGRQEIKNEQFNGKQ